MARQTALSTAAVLGMTAGPLLFLPRTARAAVEHPLKPSQCASGFAPQVMPGQAGEIRWQNKTVFHARFLDQRLPPLKWRAPALTEFDGWRWDSSRAREGRTLRPADGLVRLPDGEQLWLTGRLFTCDV